MTKAKALEEKSIVVGILDYPGAMQSAIYGWKEMFQLANQVCAQQAVTSRFETHILPHQSLSDKESSVNELQVLVLPPIVEDEYYLEPEPELVNTLLGYHTRGTLLCSACAGSFIIAATGLLDGRKVTTHWDFAEKFADKFPQVELDINQILINDQDIITAGGLMSWIDLGLELVAQFVRPDIMRLLGQLLIVDTGAREQRYYQRFHAKLDHGDEVIVKVQHFMRQHLHQSVTIAQLAEHCFLTERTFLRRFVKATGIKPTQYMQRLRVQVACELLESTSQTFENIASQLGYEDVSAFRKVFARVMGLTPREFRRRFSQ